MTGRFSIDEVMTVKDELTVYNTNGLPATSSFIAARTQFKDSHFGLGASIGLPQATLLPSKERADEGGPRPFAGLLHRLPRIARSRPRCWNGHVAGWSEGIVAGLSGRHRRLLAALVRRHQWIAIRPRRRNGRIGRRSERIRRAMRQKLLQKAVCLLGPAGGLAARLIVTGKSPCIVHQALRFLDGFCGVQPGDQAGVLLQEELGLRLRADRTRLFAPGGREVVEVLQAGVALRHDAARCALLPALARIGP